jgi:hypothetical protein
MQDRHLRCSRRKFLASAAAITLSGSAGAAAPSQPAAPRRLPDDVPPIEGRKPIAVVTTVYRTMSHAYHIANRFLFGYQVGSSLHVPRYYLASMYVDQVPENDLSGWLAQDCGVKVTRNVADALTVNGRLAVDGVLLVGEHGNYPRNDKGQILYPRLELMEQIAEVFRRTGRSVPVFNDKHLSYTFARATHMIDLARELHFPLMAGSSLPVTWRRPELEPELETRFEDALVAAYGGIEVYGFHALEALQVMLERRRGGETGVKAVTCLTGKDVWKAGDAGLWSWNLLHSALRRSESVNPGDVRRNVGAFGVGSMPAIPATAFLVEYRDGTRGTVLLLNGHIQDFVFAGRVHGETKPLSCMLHLPATPGARFFDALVANIEKLLDHGRSPYPVERTLLTTGVLDAAMESHKRRGERIETPELSVRYTAPADSGFLRGSVAADG